MDKRMHRLLTAVLTSLTGISGLLSATDPSGLGVSAQAWAWCVVVLAGATLVVQAARQAFETGG